MIFLLHQKNEKEEEADALVKMCEGNSIHILKVERKQKKQIRQSYMILLRCKEKQTDFWIYGTGNIDRATEIV